MKSLKEFDEQLQNLALKTDAKGLSTQNINRILKDIFEKKHPSSAVSQLARGFDEEQRLWESRKLDEEYYFVFIDTIS